MRFGGIRKKGIHTQENNRFQKHNKTALEKKRSALRSTLRRGALPRAAKSVRNVERRSALQSSLLFGSIGKRFKR